MKQLLLLFIFITTIGNAQIKDFFKYSTFYTSMTMNTKLKLGITEQKIT